MQPVRLPTPGTQVQGRWDRDNPIASGEGWPWVTPLASPLIQTTLPHLMQDQANGNSSETLRGALYLYGVDCCPLESSLAQSEISCT